MIIVRNLTSTKHNISKMISKILVVLTFLSGPILIPECDKVTNEDMGNLEGKISIGPICPVESVPPDPKCQPTAETYKAYPVAVWTADGSRRISQLNPSIEGFYSTTLNPGKYEVILEIRNSIGGSNLPVEVNISPDKTTTLNIEIDTGIR